MISRLASRFVFVEGVRPQIEAFGAKLVDRLGVDRDYASAVAQPLPSDVGEEVEVMSAMGDLKAFGGFDGRRPVILSDTPVIFHPSNKTSNVVMVDTLDDAVRYVNVATQTIGVYPYERKAQLRDRLAGAQRLCRLGTANAHALGSPHDAMYPLQRLVHGWPTTTSTSDRAAQRCRQRPDDSAFLSA
jgi:hypothetical protein